MTESPTCGLHQVATVFCCLDDVVVLLAPILAYVHDELVRPLARSHDLHGAAGAQACATKIMGTEGLVFPSPGTSRSGEPRDRRNVARVFREVLDEAGYPWATPHTLRRTVASLIDQSGLSVAEAADYLGHCDAAMTARVYLGRRSTTARAACVL